MIDSLMVLSMHKSPHFVIIFTKTSGGALLPKPPRGGFVPVSK